LAFREHLIPLFKKQLEERLTNKGQDAVLQICENELEKLISVGPFKLKEEINEDGEVISTPLTVLGNYFILIF
jgi:hypothetical protein